MFGSSLCPYQRHANSLLPFPYPNLRKANIGRDTAEGFSAQVLVAGRPIKGAVELTVSTRGGFGSPATRGPETFSERSRGNQFLHTSNK